MGLPHLRRPRYLFKDMGLEIERKWLPFGEAYKKMIRDTKAYSIEQGYLCTDPVIRVRKENDSFYLTYKGTGMMVREEYDLPLTKDAYDSLILKCEGRVIRKKRYRLSIKDGLTLEIDEFLGDLDPLVLFEIEFPDKECAEKYQAPDYFGKDVTADARYTNAYLSSAGIDVNEILC